MVYVYFVKVNSDQPGATIKTPGINKTKKASKIGLFLNEFSFILLITYTELQNHE